MARPAVRHPSARPPAGRLAPDDRATRQFNERVYAAACRIPVGRVATYGDVARMAGRPRAWRAVGNAMRTCERPEVPCHRVVAAGGRLGGYGRHVWLKQRLLEAEGITVRRGRIATFPSVRWPPPGRPNPDRPGRVS